MNKDIRIVVSAEDSPYMLWQSILFRHSCLTRVGVEPYFVVHRFPGRRALSDSWPAAIPPERIIEAPSYRGIVAGEPYYPRNSAGTLCEAANVFRDGWIVLCDPDMLFVRDPKFKPRWECSRVHYNPQPWYTKKEKKVEPRLMSVGVPYIVEARWARWVGGHWLSRIDSVKNYVWEVSMWEYVYTLRDLKIKYRSSNLCATNEGKYPMRGEPMIHYCYGTERWDKRNYSRDRDAISVFENVPAKPLTNCEAEIFRQLREVGGRIKRGEPSR